MSIFSYDGLRQFYRALNDAAPVMPLGHWDRTSRVALVRHDVDLSVRPAYDLYLLEADLGLRTTYLFLTTCHTYNVRSAVNRALIREMAEGGAEIGLHFDPTLYGDNGALRTHVSKEAEILSDVTGCPVTSISLHNPTAHGQYPMFDGYLNAYDKPFFEPDRYLSDSCMSFRGKEPFEIVEVAKRKTVQVLLHPLHFTQDGSGYPQVIERHLSQQVADLDDQFRPFNSAYADQMPARPARDVR